MARQECSLIALSMPGAEHQRGHRLTVGSEDPARRGPGSDVMAPEGGFRAEIFFNREIYAPVRRLPSRPKSRHRRGQRRGSINVDGSRRGVPLKKRNFVRVLSNFAPKGFLPQRGPCGSGHSAPPPIVPASKLYTTPTMLSSGSTPKKKEFCRDSVEFCAGPFFPNATPIYRTFRPGGLVRPVRRPDGHPDGPALPSVPLKAGSSAEGPALSLVLSLSKDCRRACPSGRSPSLGVASPSSSTGRPGQVAQPRPKGIVSVLTP